MKISTKMVSAGYRYIMCSLLDKPDARPVSYQVFGIVYECKRCGDRCKVDMDGVWGHM